MITIKSIYVKNFRSIKEETFELNKNMNAILGANNVGKSNLLEIIKRCLGNKWLSTNAFSQDDIYKKDTSQNIIIKIIFNEAILYKKLKDSPPTEIWGFQFEYKPYKKGEEIGKYHLEQRCLKQNGEIINTVTTKLEKGKGAISEPLTNIPPEVKEQVNVIYMGLPRSIENQLPSAPYSFLRVMFSDICKEIEENPTTKAQYDELIEKILKLLSNDEFKNIEMSIKNNTKKQLGIDCRDSSLDVSFSSFTPFTFFNNLRLVLKEKDFEIDATELGQGLQNAIVLSIMKSYEELKKKGAIMIVEEPESFLHPQKQKFLYQTFEEISKTNQIIYTTHSPYFVALPNFYQIIRLIKGNDGTKVENAHSETWHKLAEELWGEKEDLKIIKDFDTEAREFFFSKAVIVVEGDTEKLSLPIYANRLNINLNAADISIVCAKGKGNLDKFVRISKTLNIPTLLFYDIDKKAKEADQIKNVLYNQKLDALADDRTKIIRFDKNYEEELKKTFGEEKYLQLCTKFGDNKAIRAAEIARDVSLITPLKIQDGFTWLLEQIKQN